MKFGLRKFSPNKRLSSRITSIGTRNIKRTLIPGYGKKSTGWITNPKQATYNQIHNKATVSVDKILQKQKGVNNNNLEYPRQNNNFVWILGIIMIAIVLIVGLYMVLGELKKLNEGKQKYIAIQEGRTISSKVTDNIEKNNKYIDEFTYATKVNRKRFIEFEVTSKFKIMMQNCGQENIYNRLFDNELKNRITIEQYKEYNINAMAIEAISANFLDDNNVIISFHDSINKKGYVLIMKDEKITDFKQV